MNQHAREKLSADPEMAQLIAEVGPLKFRARRRSPFESLTQAIVYQQLSGKAADTIFGRFKALFGSDAFPAPHEVVRMSPEQLRSAGLSRAKAGYILDIAHKTRAGLVPSLDECDSLKDEELIERLTEIKGVGRWTAEMLLIFNLGRPDVLPVLDLGVRRGYQVIFKKRKLPEPEKLKTLGAHWAPHRTTAALYLWQAANRAQEKRSQ